MNDVVKLERHDVIAIVTVNSPPVNALSAAVRRGIFESVQTANADPEVQAIVIACAGRTFIAGADITEFGKPPQQPSLNELIAEKSVIGAKCTQYIEAASKGDNETAICRHILGWTFHTSLELHALVARPSLTRDVLQNNPPCQDVELNFALRN